MKRRAIAYSLVAIFVFALSAYFFKTRGQDNVLAFVSYYGSIASVFGIIITLIEVYHSEKIARTTKDEVRKKIDVILRTEVQSTIINAVNDCIFIIDGISNENFASAVSCCRNLRDKLIVINGDRNSWISSEAKGQLQIHANRIKLDIESLERARGNKQFLNKTPFLSHYEDLRGYLKQLEQRFKSYNPNDL